MLRWMKNIDIFEDTIKQCKTNPKLILAIMRSIRGQRVYLENDNTIASYQSTQNSEKAKVIISEKRSFEAAMPYAKAGKRVCVLNFAAWTTPGGGVESGCSAQEESLCRCSTLYPCISSEETFKSFCYNFEVIEFPIFHKSEEDKNFSAFKKYISG